MAPHSSTLAWKIPRMEEPGRLQSMESLRVGHNWATSLSLFTFMHWRRKWHPTPVFLPGESQGRGEPSGLPSMGSHRVGHDWSDLAAAAAIFWSMYVPHLLYPFIHQWTLRLLPCPGCCKYCGSVHLGACIFLNYGFLWMYAPEWDCRVIC